MPGTRDEDVLPITEEQLHISTERKVSGRVQVRTETETIESLVPVELSHIEIDVTRVPVGRKVDTMPDVVTEGDLTVVPVVEERVVVTRELYLLEELHIRRVEQRETTEIPVTTRRQTAHVDRLPPEQGIHDDTPPNSKENQDDL